MFNKNIFMPAAITCCVLVTVTGSAKAQQQNQPVTPVATFPTVNIPGAYPSNTPLNFIRSWDAKSPISDPNAMMNAGYQQTKQTTIYFNGPSRVLQSVERQATPGAKDQVTPHFYDQFGRESQQYLPYAAGDNTGAFKYDPFNAQNNFLQTQYSGEKVFYSQTVLEASPLNRVLQKMAPGNSWAGNNKGTGKDYLINRDGDGVRIWTISNDPLTYANDDVTTNIPGSAASAYGAGKLTKSVIRDENGNAVVEYKDMDGNPVLKKVQVGNIAADYSGYAGFLCTYFVYDDLKRLRFVIPPAAVNAINGTWTLPADVINGLCFRYEYDSRNRMIAKKDPGAGWVYMVYDMRDRLVFTQDGNLRNRSEWNASLYDGLNRVIMTGIVTGYTGGVAALQTLVTSQKTPTQNPPPGMLADLVLPNGTQTGPFSGTYQASNSITLDLNFQTAAGQDFTASIFNATVVDVPETSVVDGMTVNKNPVPATATFIPLTKTYYDNYSWTNVAYTTAYNSKLDAGNNANALTMPTQNFTQVKGLITGKQIRVVQDPNSLVTGAWMSTVNFYDDHLRVIQTWSDNMQGSNIITNLYDYTGGLLCSYLDHTKPNGSPGNVHVKTNMEYDHAGRLLEVWKTINDDPSKKALIAKSSYDELGHLVKKELGRQKDNNGAYTTDPVETLNYSYNVRGWLTGINKDYANDVTPAGSTAPWFGMEVDYDQGFQHNQLNGNIAGAKWRSKGDGVRRAYGYTYDASNRLMGADFTQYNGTGYADDPIVKYDVQLGDGQTVTSAYDANGNIQAMTQWGFKVNNSQIIDDMLYNYYINSNKLSGISEQYTGTADHNLGDFTDHNTSGDDYGYDASGNLVTDKNKRLSGTTGTGITTGGAIVYNQLNLPYQISVQDANGNSRGTLTYTYDALGNRLQKTISEKNVPVVYNDVNYMSDVTTTTNYYGGFTYETKVYNNSSISSLGYTDKLLFLQHEEGRTRYIEAKGNALARFEHDYFVKDNIDNVRMVLTEENQQDVYPAATLEGDLSTSTDAAYTEKQFFTIDPANVVDKSQATGITDYENNNGNPPYNNNSNSNVTANSQKLYKLVATTTGGATGLGITLKVMSGDQIDVYGKSYYFDNNAGGKNYTIPAAAIVGGLFGAPGSTAGVHAVTTADVNGQPALISLINGFLNNTNRNNNDNITNNAPKAYINWMLFDENFKYLDGNFDRVGSANVVKSHALNGIPVKQNGYLYVYVSNESPVNVFFDNLQVIHSRGALLEETHYYPFGLTMAGISSKAAGLLVNKKKFTSQELDEELDWNVYQFRYRSMDPQTGRFLQVDPLASKYVGNSPYAYAENKVTAGIDVEGLELLPFNSSIFRFNATKDNTTYFTNSFSEYIDLVIENVPDVFTDDGGNPLFSPASVNIGPHGLLITGNETGQSLLPGNYLPAVPGYTFAETNDMPDDIYEHHSNHGTEYTHAGSAPYSYDGTPVGNELTRYNAYQEISKWNQLYSHDKPIWDAYNSLNESRQAGLKSIELVDRFAKSIAANMKGGFTPAFRAALINFISDGTLPNIDISNFRLSFENSLMTMWYGIQILNRSGNDDKIQQNTLDTFNNYLQGYNSLNPSYNFNLGQLNNK